MPAFVFATILFAAAFHAVWNAIVKDADDKLQMAVLVAGSAAAIAATVLPFVQQPAPASWPYLAVSTVLQCVYYALVANAYRAADMSQTYPMMRGTAPLLVASASALWLGEAPSPMEWAGVVLISAGVAGMSLSAWARSNMAGVGLALANAVVIAAYTITDGLGVRQSGAAAGYTLWLFLLNGIPLVVWMVLWRRAAFVRHIADNIGRGAVGGIGTLVSYGLALWAMTVVPVAMVAALRETAILFALAIAGLFLKERIGPARLAAALVIAAGAATLRLA